MICIAIFLTMLVPVILPHVFKQLYDMDMIWMVI